MFEKNVGQSDRKVRYLHRGAGYTLFLTAGAAVWSTRAGASLKLRPIGSSRCRMTALEAVAGKSHYLIGNDPTKWIPNIARYRKVLYRQVYPGIDLVYYGTGAEVEHDFIVSPGADPARIRIALEGTGRPRLNEDGDLVALTYGGSFRLRGPRIYQQRDGRRLDVDGAFEMRGDDGRTIGFRVGAYDRSAPLVIDPVVSYSSFLGGGDDEVASAIAVDGSGNAYVAGSTVSADFPATTISAQRALAGSTDVFVAKLNSTGTALIYATYLGGSGHDSASHIAIDSGGAATIAGNTESSDFPVFSGSFRRNKAGGQDIFVARLNETGSGLLYSTYLGGSGHDTAGGLALDPSGNAYVGGTTTSNDFPTTSGAFRTSPAGNADGFIVKLDRLGEALVYGTRLGGSDLDRVLDVAADSSGNAWATGSTASPDFPTTPGVSQPIKNAGEDVFVSRLSNTGATLIYSTFLGGGGNESGNSIALDAAGNAHVAGTTSSINFPVTSGVVQTTIGGGRDAFVAKLDPFGARLLFSTFFGGSGTEMLTGIAVDVAGNIYLLGSTSSIDLPVTTDASQRSFQTVGVFKSTDGGAVWRPSAAGVGEVAISCLAIDPGTPAIIYAGTALGGVRKSADAGATWADSSAGLTDSNVQVLAIDPANPANVYAGTQAGGVYKSTNRGTSWTAINAGLPAASGVYSSVNALIIDPSAPSTLYAGTSSGVFKSVDGGSLWAASNNGLISLNVTGMAIDPYRPLTVYAATGTLGVFKSPDGGRNWLASNLGMPAAAIHSLVLDPVSLTSLYAVLSGLGVYKTTNGGTSWSPQNLGLTRTDIRALALDPRFPARIYAATGAGVFKSFDGAATWDLMINGLNTFTTALAVDPVATTTVYAGTDGGTDVFMARLNAAGSVPAYASYLGGARSETGGGIAVDTSGAVYLTGSTRSRNFPITSGVLQSTLRNSDAFVTRILIDAAPIRLTLFAQMAVGGGFSTIFTIPNTGAETASGNLTLTDQSGNPLIANLAGISSPSVGAEDRVEATGSSFALTIPPGAVRSYTATALSPSDPTRSGWARLESTGGSPGGVATFQYSEVGSLRTVAGVLSSRPTAAVTIPVDNDAELDQFAGFAVANPGDENLNISLITIDEDGRVVDSVRPPDMNPLGPRRQVAKFLHQYLPARTTFRGSIVLASRNGRMFAAVALVIRQGLLTAVPVIPDKAPNIPID